MREGKDKGSAKYRERSLISGPAISMTAVKRYSRESAKQMEVQEVSVKEWAEWSSHLECCNI